MVGQVDRSAAGGDQVNNLERVAALLMDAVDMLQEEISKRQTTGSADDDNTATGAEEPPRDDR